MNPLPYRPNVGGCLFARDGRVLVARRAGTPNAEGSAGGWQLPQGGVDEGEELRAAIAREMREEVGTDRFSVLAEHGEWLTYDFPAGAGIKLAERFRGQKQRWFALRFEGTDADIRLDTDEHVEFDAWRWAPLSEIPSIAVGFKRPIYERLATDFSRFAVPAGP